MFHINHESSIGLTSSNFLQKNNFKKISFDSEYFLNLEWNNFEILEQTNEKKLTPVLSLQ